MFLVSFLSYTSKSKKRKKHMFHNLNHSLFCQYFPSLIFSHMRKIFRLCRIIFSFFQQCILSFQVDRAIGKDHLFKRSIILIKAWCYYESRILGAHHGLISTYALETLVLYIFHLYHSTLDGPLAVSYLDSNPFLQFTSTK